VIDETEVRECQAEDVGCSIRKLWLSLALEMFDIEHNAIPSEANANKWAGFVR